MIRSLHLRVLLLASAFGIASAATTPICSGAELYSKESVKYGRWEFRMLAAAKLGTVSSFFTYFDSSYISGKPWREIDIEVLGNKPNGFQSNLIATNASMQKLDTAVFQSSSDVSVDYHTYTLDWTPDSVVWRLDGVRVRKQAGNWRVAALQDKAESYRMNLWASDQTGWVGSFNLASLPVYQVVNWMAYSAYTPGQGPGGSNFTEKWVDDFIKFDTKRWGTGNYGFDTNLAMFSPDNVVAVDGYLVLALTREGQEGVTGTFKKDPLGSTRISTGVIKSRPTSGSQLSVRSNENGLSISRSDAANAQDIAVLDASGRKLAAVRFTAGQNMTELHVSKTGVVLVHSGDQTVTVVR